ncbi:DUF2625 family protein [Arthrobacter humicola]
MTPTRSADELLGVDTPAWPRFKTLLSNAAVDVSVLSADDTARRSVLYRLQVTAASTLGCSAAASARSGKYRFCCAQRDCRARRISILRHLSGTRAIGVSGTSVTSRALPSLP